MTDSTLPTLDGAFRDLSVSRDAVRWTPGLAEDLPTLNGPVLAAILRARTRRRQLSTSASRRIAANLATSHIRKDDLGH